MGGKSLGTRAQLQLVLVLFVVAYTKAVPCYTTYLLPIGLYGPNNQMAGIKEVFVWSRKLDMMLLLPRISNHHEGLKYRKWEEQSWYYSELYDVKALKKLYKVVTLKELQDQGWDGKVDLVLNANVKVTGGSFNGRVKTMCKHMNVNCTQARIVNIYALSKCDHHEESVLKAALKPNGHELTRLEHHCKHTGTPPWVVLVPTYQHLMCHPRDASFSNFTISNACQEEYMAVVHAHLRHAELRAEAERFIAEHLDCEGGYAAIHLRPYADNCMHRWVQLWNTSQPYNRTVDAKTCSRTPDLWDNFPRETAMLLKANHLKCLYVMANPIVMPCVMGLLKQHVPGIDDIRVSSYSVHDLERHVGVNDFTRLSFVEQEICLRAKVFRGTAASSMTALVVQERVADMLKEQTSSFTQDNNAIPLGYYSNCHP